MSFSENIGSRRLGDFFNHYQQIEATCSCGRVYDVHLGNVIRAYSDEEIVSERFLAGLSKRLVCIRCHARGPKLRVVVRRPQAPSALPE